MLLTLRILPDLLAVCRLAPASPLPDWLGEASFWSVTRTAQELSLVIPQERAPAGAAVEGGWRALMVEGPLDFSLTGILAGISACLAEAGISIFAISTFDTDYILVKSSRFEQAATALRTAGYRVTGQF